MVTSSLRITDSNDKSKSAASICPSRDFFRQALTVVEHQVRELFMSPTFPYLQAASSSKSIISEKLDPFVETTLGWLKMLSSAAPKKEQEYEYEAYLKKRNTITSEERLIKEKKILVLHNDVNYEDNIVLNLYEAFGTTAKKTSGSELQPLLVIEVSENKMVKRWNIRRQFSFRQSIPRSRCRSCFTLLLQSKILIVQALPGSSQVRHGRQMVVIWSPHLRVERSCFLRAQVQSNLRIMPAMRHHWVPHDAKFLQVQG
ncbi:hypothetical protein TNIN_296301 [Trichonephila inaurata madagascariensis]|uniref:Uncharacterized protein n=1 Tax=Trichonephila inaurata madagascariensis TaxID=2747483 RepID=A0A8X6XLW8_9ARAC|nr:hypothetical protein TNIN_296301 [Trichonephila inaurata madagascariensis]